MDEQKTISLRWLVIALVIIIVVGGFLIGGLILLRVQSSPQPAPAQVSDAGSGSPTSTPQPTATALPDHVSITLHSPTDDLEVDLGTPVQLVISASAGSGVHLINVTSNGQGIGSFRGMLETDVEIDQLWTPSYAGAHTIVASVSTRGGESATTEPIRIRVVDRELMARHAPIWADVEANVTEVRGLAKLEAFEPTLLSRTELRQRLQDEFFYTEEDARRDVLVLSAFDFVPANFDLYTLQRRYLGDSIAGFYDPQTKEFVVVSDDSEVDALEQWIYAHEFMHALQDQHFQLDLIADTELGFEENLAIRALAEGEAELLQSQYLELGYFDDVQFAEIFNRLSRAHTPQADYLPPVLVNQGLFPYTVGHDFARAIYRQQGWEGLNHVWQNPPRSTEQIIHPDRYFAGDVPQIVDLAPLTDTLGSEWRLIEQEVFGEFLVREYLSQRLNDSDVDQAATGWGGDRYAVYQRGDSDQLVMVLRSVWDTPNDRSQFVRGYASYADRVYGQERLRQPDGGTCWQTVDIICLYDSGSDVLIVRAPDLNMAGAVAVAARP
ncbi:MAG TPA: hypothetical protein VK879_11090 [Candidatus Sulfomarinibacteraceae bacterium]|nr:hypothetical protein [Candidatus Sulfomarinibacteraceae bacterium]